MQEVTLESLAARVAALERKGTALTTPASVIPATRGFRSVVGMFEGSEFMKRVDAEVAALKSAEPMGDEGAEQ